MNKRIIALVLAALCLVMCCACGQTEKDVRGSVTTAAPTPDDAQPATTPEPTESPVDDGFDIGSVNGTSYTNSFVGIGVELTDDWYIATEDELAGMNGAVADSLSDEELKELMAKSDSFFDFYAARTDGMATINITLENLGLLYGAVLDEASYLKMSTENMDLEKSLNDVGIEDIVIETTDVSFAGASHKAIAISGNIYAEDTAIPFYELLISCKAGNYMACVTFATYIENTTAELADMFHAVG